ncbi:MAG: hypothetical protein ACTSU2_11835, partial [Promethearchaeota archaeon]
MSDLSDLDYNDYLTPILKLQNKTFKRGVSVISSVISDSMLIFSLYGPKVENYVENLLKYRTIDQKAYADKITKEIFEVLFDPRVNVAFDVIINVTDEDEVEDELASLERLGYGDMKDGGKVKESKLKKRTKKSKSSSRLIRKKKKSKSSKDKKSHKAEIDVLISTVILPYDERKKMKYWDEGYLFVEIKLFTAPIGDRAKSLRTLLQQNVLSSYFRLRHLFGVIGTSYLSYNAPKKNEPVTWAADEYEENKDKPKWISHLILMDARVLKEYKDAPGRSKAILDAIRVDQQKILKKENINDKKYKYK